MNFSSIPNQTFTGKLLRQPLRLIPNRTVMPILQGRLKGKRWIVGAHTHGCWLGSYEHEKQKLFESNVHPGNTVFDVGAHAGFYSMLASVLVEPKGHVYAFEPHPRNVYFLGEHLRLNCIDNVEVFQAAVSDTTGETNFQESASSAMGYLACTGTRRVQTVKIDHLVFSNKVKAPDCIKIDVEGGEMLVLCGAKSALQTYGPIVFLSTHGSQVHGESCDFLSSLGYKLQSVSAKDIHETDEIFACQ